MKTRVLRVDANKPDPSDIAEAADVIRAGGLVAFPTETVYGLGAHALDPAAVGRIFAAKGRPPTNPIIVHVADSAAARHLAADWPKAAEKLARTFWPGPLTLVVSRSADVPDIVTAGGATVGIRIPGHPVALALLHAAGVPIAAPSANPSSRVSSTTAVHVLAGLDGRIDLVLNGGPCPGGLESTVVDLTATPPRLLRPGPVTREQLQTVAERVQAGSELAVPDSQPLRSPGMLERHYAPRAVLECVVGDAARRVKELRAQGIKTGWLRFSARQTGPANPLTIDMPTFVEVYSNRLYAALHALDDASAERIIVELPPNSPEWAAVRDRLRRASSP